MWNFLTQFFGHYNGTSFSLTVSLIFIALTLIIFLFNSSQKKSLPPSPPTLPIIGNLHQLGFHPHRSLRSMAQTHGPIMLLHLGTLPTLVISSAEMAREVMKANDLVFSDRPTSRISKKLLYDYKDIAGAPYGEYWRQMKGISVVHLLSSKRVQSFNNVREEETACMIEKIQKSSDSSSPVNLSEVLAALTNDVVCRVALGRKQITTKQGRKFEELLGDFVELMGFNFGSYIPWLSWIDQANGVNAKVERVAKELDDFLDGIIEAHMCNEPRGEDNKDFVDVLLSIQKENMSGFPIDLTSIKAIILDVLAAGTDSTYTLLEWAMTELLKHPGMMKKVQSEVREIVNERSVITANDLERMLYLKAIMKETFRFHPPLPLLVPRVSTQDVRIKGYDIATGTQAIINAWAIGRDPAVWDRAEEFWPERFLNSSVDYRGHDFQLLPFGGGRRICPGIQFATSLEELALANLLHKFDWALPDGVKEDDLDMTESVGLTVHRKFPLLAVATPHFH
ncbi:cytochrome P450 736A117 [Ricinus communis]|uniref:Cytochrome P450, putative n=1 Tax=Ricinus communis TaxID=3988 RepID=B9RAR9_RICCO|nr:cytochrome P450 736A117 [Ricinus communis]EEF51896.1 cytochrome P450, putative [Ricinus communis]|eukprot:XP_002511294.1 cytochrome P450 71A26 [Ricinus communis]